VNWSDSHSRSLIDEVRRYRESLSRTTVGGYKLTILFLGWASRNLPPETVSGLKSKFETPVGSMSVESDRAEAARRPAKKPSGFE